MFNYMCALLRYFKYQTVCAKVINITKNTVFQINTAIMLIHVKTYNIWPQLTKVSKYMQKASL